MLSCYVGKYDLRENKADVWAVFWSQAHAMDYAKQLSRIMSDGRVLFMLDGSGHIRFYCDGWETYEKATARDLCGVHPLSAWSDHGVKAGKAVVLGAIREAVEAVA